jgi:CubicO group peptidase (beta-lactamase class C family)
MTTMAERRELDRAHWQRRLTELAGEHRVPGAGLGIFRLGADGADDELAVAVHGVTSVATGVEVTEDTAFQIGSISKVWTATVVLQLVDEGKLDLDAPITDVLPDLRLGDPKVTAQVTMRHLLTHTSGIDGDIFTDTGRGDDCLEEYVASLADAAQNHPLGATFSYCNSGFSLAGRVIEVLTGRTWDAAIRERVFAPLGLTHTSTLPEEAILGRAAVGHVGEPDEEPRPAPIWVMQRSAGPAGLINSTPRDVAMFARMHLAGGVTPDGVRVLSAGSVAQMQERQTDLPDKHTLGDGWGLGWILFGWDGRRLIGHDGNTIGQSAFLRVLPDEGLAVVLLTNGGHAKDLFQQLYAEIFADVAGVRMPAPLEPPSTPPQVDPARYVGVYERTSVTTEILQGGGGLVLRSTSTGPLAALDGREPTHEYDLVPVAEDLFAMRPPGLQTWIPVTFYRLPDGAEYVHYGVRANPRRS